jgi:signal transduction histidine kinase
LVVVGHKIAALEAYVKNDPCLAEKLAQIAEKVAELAKDLHRTSRELHPSTAEDLGLPPALAEECEAFEERSGIPTSLSAVNVPPELSKEVTLCLYRIAQESLRNIGKHAAEAGSVEIRLEGAAEELTLRITDTGNGFDAAEVRKKGGLGLISMEERARLLGGGCLVRSKPGRGTTIIVTVPTMQKSSKNVKKKASGKG